MSETETRLSIKEQSVHELVGVIRQHPAYRHRVFRVLAHERPPTEKLESWLSHMAMFCAEAREVFRMPEHLRFLGLEHQAHIVECIRANESSHADLYLRMAHRLVGTPIKVPSKETPAISRMKTIFCARDCEDFESVYYSLGSYLALEVVTEHHIIPGQIKAFVKSGHYGAKLDDPCMEYLAKHRKEFEAEEVRKLQILAGVQILPENPTAATLAKQGVTEFMHALQELYDELTEIVVKP